MTMNDTFARRREPMFAVEWYAAGMDKSIDQCCFKMPSFHQAEGALLIQVQMLKNTLKFGISKETAAIKT